MMMMMSTTTTKSRSKARGKIINLFDSCRKDVINPLIQQNSFIVSASSDDRENFILRTANCIRFTGMEDDVRSIDLMISLTEVESSRDAFACERVLLT